MIKRFWQVPLSQRKKDWCCSPSLLSYLHSSHASSNGEECQSINFPPSSSHSPPIPVFSIQITRCSGANTVWKLTLTVLSLIPQLSQPASAAHSLLSSPKHWTSKRSLGIQASALLTPRYLIPCLLTRCYRVTQLSSPTYYFPPSHPPPPSEPSPPRCGSRLHPRGPTTKCRILPSSGQQRGAAAAFILISFLLPRPPSPPSPPSPQPGRRAMTTCTYSSLSWQRHYKCVKKCHF